MHHKHLLYLLVLSSLPLNTMDDHKDANKMNIHEAVYRGNMEQVKKLLDSGVNVDEKAQRNCDYLWFEDDSPLHIALGREERLMMQLRLEPNASVNVKNCRENRLMIQLLLERNASVNVKNYDGRTSFLVAISIARPEYVKLFLDFYDADTKQKNNHGYSSLYNKHGYSPLYLAVLKHHNLHPIEHLSIVKMLIKHNAHVRIKHSHYEDTPLDYLQKIDGIKRFYLDYEKSLKKEKKKKSKEKKK